MIPAYEGNEPYIFVSYAHKDSASIFRIIEMLNKRGYRVWYDEGIEPGSEWPEYIANHLLRADVVMAFLTPRSVKSVNCRREINFALSKDKPVLTIFMEDLEVPAGMQLQLSAQQSVLYYQYDSEERFLDKVETCQYLGPCRRDDDEKPLSGADTVPAAVSKSEGTKKPVKAAVIAGICLIALLCIFWIAGLGGKDSQPTAGGTSPSETPAAGKTAEPTAANSGEGTSLARDEGTQSPDLGNAAVSQAEESWNYTISRSTENTTYSFDRGPQIVIPASWDGMVTVVDEGEQVAFYHTASMTAWEVKGYESTGYLFKLCLSETQDYIDLPSYADLGKTQEGYFYLMFPSDFQGYAENERIRDQYLELNSEISYVKMNSYLAEK